MQRPDRLALVPLPKHAGELQAGELLALADQLCQPGRAHVEIHQLIPGGFAHHAVHSQVENTLELPHGLLGGRAEHAADGPDLGNGRIAAGHPVQGALQHQDIASGVAQPQGRAGVGGLHVLNRRVHHQLYVVAVVVAQNLHGVVALLGQLLAAPLGQAVAGAGGAVAELGRKGLHKAGPADVVVKNLVHDLGDIFKNIPALDKFLVIGRGGCDLKVIAPAGVELGIDPVQGKGDDRQYVGPDGGWLPGGVYLAGGHVFHIIRERDRNIFRPLVGQSHMYRDGCRDVGKNHRHRSLTNSAGEYPTRRTGRSGWSRCR